MNPLEIIPPELISKILADLNARDLCNVALTSKRFYSAVSDPFLWKTTRISKKTAIERGVPSLMEITRFRNHRDLDFSRLWCLPKVWNSLFLGILNSQTLKSLDISSPENLEYVDFPLCAEALASVRSLNISNTKLSGKKFIDILEKITQKNITKELCLTKTDLTEVPLETFKELLGSLEFCDLNNACLNREQLCWLMKTREGKCRVAFRCESGDIHDTLSVCDDVIVSEIIPGMFSRLSTLVWKLVDFSGIPPDRWVTILRGMWDGLENLSIEGMGLDLGNVPGDIIAESFSKRKELSLSGIDLSADQWTTLLNKMTSHTKKLSLRMINLSGVNTEVLVKAFANTRSLELNYVHLSTEQWNILFQRSFPCIPALAVINVNLSEIMECSLIPSVRRVEELNLASTYLNIDQQTTILNTIRTNRSLKYLNLAGINLSEVGSELLANTVAEVTRVNLAATKLQAKQVVSLMSRILGSSRLRELDLGGVNIGQVPSRILAIALSRLRCVDLCNCMLGREQLKEFCSQVQDGFSALESVSFSRNLLLLNPVEVRKLGSHVYINLH